MLIKVINIFIHQREYLEYGKICFAEKGIICITVVIHKNCILNSLFNDLKRSSAL